MDIGANIGVFTVLVRKSVPNSRVYAFEPIFATYGQLLATLKASGTDALTYRCGLSDHEGYAIFTNYPRLNTLSTQYPADQAIRSQDVRQIIGDHDRLSKRVLERIFMKSHDEVCPVTTISTFVRKYSLERVDLVKIDAEGAEVAILDGVSADDWSRVIQVAIEIHSEQLMHCALNILRRGGFSTMVGQGYRRAKEEARAFPTILYGSKLSALPAFRS